MGRRPIAATLLLLVAACEPSQPDPAAVERIDLDAPVEREPKPNGGLPDAAGAGWEVAPDGRSLRYANPAGEPLLSLACLLPADEPARIKLVQFAPAPPGARAMFAVVGNGMVARVMMDAELADNRWRWEGSVPADAPKLDVLTGDREIIATMPGGGEIEMAASPLPRELVNWCRAQGAPPEPQPLASPTPLASPQPTQPG